MNESIGSQRPPVRVALMGLGRAMFEEHYPIFRDHPGLFKVVAACDLVKERRSRVAKDFPNCRMFRQYSDMLDELDIDLIDIATCTRDHVKHAIAALSRGYWTLIESPMAITYEDAQVLRGAATKARNRLIVMQRGLFDADYMLARQAMADSRLGKIHQICISRGDYVRRDDWQCVRRLGGGASYYAMTDLLVQAIRLMPLPPVQMWCELKRVASLGDAEDYVRVCFKTRESLTADLVYNGGMLPGDRAPSYVIRGDRGVFKVEAGATTGTMTVIDPNFNFPRRRSSVRTPPIADLHEQFPVVDIPMTLPPNTPHGAAEFWHSVYQSIRTAEPFPVRLEDSFDAIKYAHLMKKSSTFRI